MIHAFMRRAHHTCSTCWSNKDGFCSCNGCVIRWNPDHFGCGSYATGDGPFRPRQTSMEAFR